jgi:hypothetical protein
MRNQEDFAGWYYRKEGKTLGPISTQELRRFLRSGQVLPRQAVWQEQAFCSLFVHAETAACSAEQQARETNHANQRSNDPRRCLD